MDVSDGPSAQPSTAPKGLSPFIVGLAIFCFFPLGLYLLWKHPTLSSKKAWWWAAGMWAVVVVLSAGREDAGVPDADEPTGATESAIGSDKPLSDNDQFTSWPETSTGRRNPVEMTKVFEVRMGMSEDVVASILGQPHKKQRMLIKATPFSPQRETQTWSYKGDHPDDFIIVGFENGRVSDGGSQGWDFDKAFIGTPAEKKRIIEHYMRFLKNGGKPPFNNLNPPAPGGT